VVVVGDGETMGRGASTAPPSGRDVSQLKQGPTPSTRLSS
jgi:hypothetical protein